MRAKIRQKVIKMIKIITLIPASIAYLMIAGCGGQGSKEAPPGAQPDVDVSGTPDDPLRQLQEEGRLPTVGTSPKMAPPLESGAEALSLFPPDVDPDQDNVPNSAVSGHPEIPVDNCPNVFNPGQEDDDGDGVGNACEG